MIVGIEGKDVPFGLLPDRDAILNLPYENFKSYPMQFRSLCKYALFFATRAQQVVHKSGKAPVIIAFTPHNLMLFDCQTADPLRIIPYAAIERVVTNVNRKGYFVAADGGLYPNIPPSEPFIIVLLTMAISGTVVEAQQRGELNAMLNDQIFDLCFAGPEASDVAAAMSRVRLSLKAAAQQIPHVMDTMKESSRAAADTAAASGTAITIAPSFGWDADMSNRLSDCLVSFRTPPPVASKEALLMVQMSARALALGDEMITPTRHGRITAEELDAYRIAHNAAAVNALATTSSAGASVTGTAASSPDPNRIPGRFATIDPTTKLHYCDVPNDALPLFPSLRGSAVFWFDRVLHWEPPHRPRLIFAYVSYSHLYLSESDNRCLRCIPLDSIAWLILPEEPAVAFYDAMNNNLASHGVLIRFRPAEHDMYVAFCDETEVRVFVKLLAFLATSADPSVTVQFMRPATLQICQPKLTSSPNYLVRYVDVPPRAISAVQPPTGKAPASNASKASSSGGNNLFVIPIPASVSNDFPMLAYGAALWYENIFDLNDAAAKFASKGSLLDDGGRRDRNPLSQLVGGECVIGCLSNTHFYMCRSRHHTTLGCTRWFSLQQIRKILVHFVKSDRAFGATRAATAAEAATMDLNRYIVLLVNKEPEYDALFMFPTARAVETFIDAVCAARGAWSLPANHPDAIADVNADRSGDSIRSAPVVGVFTDLSAETQRLIRPDNYRPATACPLFPKVLNAPSYQERIQCMMHTYGVDHFQGYSDSQELLDGNKGREDFLIAELVRRYGPEPILTPEQRKTRYGPLTPEEEAALAAAHRTAAERHLTDVEKRIVRMLKKYCAHRLHMMRSMMTAYNDDPDLMLADLIKRYGPEPGGSDETIGGRTMQQIAEGQLPEASSETKHTLKQEIMRFALFRRDPVVFSKASELADRHAATAELSELMWKALEGTRGPRPTIEEFINFLWESDLGAPRQIETPEKIALRRKLLRFTALHAADSSGDVDRIMAKTDARSPMPLWEKLMKKFPERRQAILQIISDGAPPSTAGDGGSTTTAAGAVPPARSAPPAVKTIADATDVRCHLIRYVAHYNTDALGDVDNMLIKYKGREGEMWEKLFAKYGPPPPSPADAGGSPSTLPPYGVRPLDGTDMTMVPRNITIDMPFVDLDPAAKALFPSLDQAAIYYFGTVGHWDPPEPITKRFVFISAQHLYIADDEYNIRRCILMKVISDVYSCTRRIDRSAPCHVLLRCQPHEHDVVLAFQHDADARRFVWVMCEVISRYFIELNVKVHAAVTLTDPGLRSDCLAAAWYSPKVVPVAKRPTEDVIRQLLGDQGMKSDLVGSGGGGGGSGSPARGVNASQGYGRPPLDPGPPQFVTSAPGSQRPALTFGGGGLRPKPGAVEEAAAIRRDGEPEFDLAAAEDVMRQGRAAQRLKTSFASLGWRAGGAPRFGADAGSAHSSRPGAQTEYFDFREASVEPEAESVAVAAQRGGSDAKRRTNPFGNVEEFSGEPDDSVFSSRQQAAAFDFEKSYGGESLAFAPDATLRRPSNGGLASGDAAALSTVDGVSRASRPPASHTPRPGAPPSAPPSDRRPAPIPPAPRTPAGGQPIHQPSSGRNSDAHTSVDRRALSSQDSQLAMLREVAASISPSPPFSPTAGHRSDSPPSPTARLSRMTSDEVYRALSASVGLTGANLVAFRGWDGKLLASQTDGQLRQRLANDTVALGILTRWIQRMKRQEAAAMIIDEQQDDPDL